MLEGEGGLGLGGVAEESGGEWRGPEDLARGRDGDGPLCRGRVDVLHRRSWVKHPPAKRRCAF